LWPLRPTTPFATRDGRGSERLLDLIDRAATDVNITFDQYPYGAGTSALSTLLPPWAQEGGPGALLARLADPSDRRAIVRDVARGLPGWENLLGVLSPERVVIVAAAPPGGGDIGKTLAALADERGVNHVTAALDLLLDARLDVTSIEHYAEESLVTEIACHPRQLVGSDAIFSTRPHPRLYGTAARFLGRWAIREGLLPVEEAVAKLG
jgi:N-acyl-D-amino-acid deacylase